MINRENGADRFITAAAAAARVRQGSRVYIGGCLAEPTAILDAVAAQPDLWREVTLTGAFVPGFNTRNHASLGIASRVEAIFATQGLQADDTAVSIMPLHYSEYAALLARPGHVDIAFFHVAPPRADGTIGLGPSVDFAPSVIAAGARLIGVVHPDFPDVLQGPRYPADRFEAFVPAETPLADYDAGSIDTATAAIAGHVAAAIVSGDTVQFGLGKVQAAVLALLGNHQGLGFHGGMVSTPVLPLIRAGIFSKGVVTGVALGSHDFVKAVAREPGVFFAPVSRTHAHGVLAGIERLVAVNSVIAVDLFGQANADTTNGRQVSGHGGMVDFVRGAKASPGGRSILALPASAKGGSISRIVAALGPTAPASVSRADADIVVTEYGLANLRYAGIEERAQMLISIAAPQFREDLRSAWNTMR